MFPKFKKGDATVRVLKTCQTFNYINDLMSEVCEVGLAPLKQAKDKATPEVPAPPPLCANYTRPNKDEALKNLRSRFTKTPKDSL